MLLKSMIAIAILFATGCVTTRKSRVPEFIERLGQSYTPEQKAVIGEMLGYINDLEYEARRK